MSAAREQDAWQLCTGSGGTGPAVWRFRVPGGWLYFVAADTQSTVFVPDPEER